MSEKRSRHSSRSPYRRSSAQSIYRRTPNLPGARGIFVALTFRKIGQLCTYMGFSAWCGLQRKARRPPPPPNTPFHDCLSTRLATRWCGAEGSIYPTQLFKA